MSLSCWLPPFSNLGFPSLAQHLQQSFWLLSHVPLARFNRQEWSPQIFTQMEEGKERRL